jgi:hypothetical protein
LESDKGTILRAGNVDFSDPALAMEAVEGHMEEWLGSGEFSGASILLE